MNNYLLTKLTTISLLVSTFCFSQQKATKDVDIEIDNITKEIIIDPKNNFIRDPYSVKIKIKNFNPFLFYLTVKEKQGAYQNNELLGEQVFNSLEFNQAYFNLQDISINIKPIPVHENRVDSGDVRMMKDSLDKMEGKLDIMRSRLRLMLDTLELLKIKSSNPRNDKYKTDTFPDDSLRFARDIGALDETIEVEQGIFRKIENKIEALIKEGQDTNNRIKLYNQKVEKFIDNCFTLNNLVFYYQDLKSILTVDGQTFDEINRRKKEGLIYYFPKLKNVELSDFTPYFKGLVAEFQMAFVEIQDYYFFLKDNPVDKNYKASIDNSFLDLKLQYEKINFELLKLMIERIGKIYSSINKENFTLVYRSSILDDDAEHIRFEILANPIRSTEAALFTKTAPLVVSVPVVGGWKISVSSGPMFAFGLSDNSFRYERSKFDSSKYRVIRNSNSNFFNPVLAVMLHMYPRNGLRTNAPGFSFGVGTGDIERIRYFVGFGWRFGRKQWMNVIGGVVGGQVTYADESVLERDISLSDADLTKPIPLRNPSPFRIGGFVGITFNLLGANSIFNQKLK